MKLLKWLPLVAVGLSMTIASCEKTNIQNPDTPVVLDEAAMDKAVAAFVDDVVVPTYDDLSKAMEVLHAKAQALAEAKDAKSGQARLEEACDAWRVARIPWEMSEAFLFGTAEADQLDPSLDTWPLDKDGIDQILASNKPLGQSDEESDQKLRGFHTAEYILFEGGVAKKFADLTPRMKEYLLMVTDRLVRDGKALYHGWAEGEKAYGNIMKQHKGNGIASVYAAVQQIYAGMEDISNEVGTAKIGEPYTMWKDGKHEDAVLAVESWYSWNSLDDYMNNIKSIRNSFYCSRNGKPAVNSLYSLLKIKDADLCKKIDDQIVATINAINDIPVPFRSNLDKDTEILKAQDACATLNRMLGEARAKFSN